MSKIFISGFPRAGTTVLMLMMNSFVDCQVEHREAHPIVTPVRLKAGKNLVIKQPFGCFEDFPPEYHYKDLLDYKIVSMVRDPRDVLVSKHKTDYSIYWVTIDMVLRNCEEYLANLDNENVIFIRYEDLVQDPHTEMGRLSGFLGLSYADSFDNFYKLPEAATLNALHTPRKIDTASIGRYKLPEHIKRLSECMSPKLEEYIIKLGYKL